MKNIAQPNRIDVMQGIYKCPELKTNPIRKGIDDAYKLPSRMGDTLHYPDGTKEKLK